MKIIASSPAGILLPIFLTGKIASYAQTSAIVKYYYRYKIFEPYFQDDWRVNKRLTLNLGLRVSMFQTNRDSTRTSFNFEPAVYAAAASTAPSIDVDGSITGVPGALIPSAYRQSGPRHGAMRRPRRHGLHSCCGSHLFSISNCRRYKVSWLRQGSPLQSRTAHRICL